MCSPTCSFPLNTYKRHPTDGLRASGGSWYLSTVPVPSACFTVFVAAARRPEAPKFGFALSSGDLEREPPAEGAREGRRGEAERREEPSRLSRRRSLSLSPPLSLAPSRSRSRSLMSLSSLSLLSLSLRSPSSRRPHRGSSWGRSSRLRSRESPYRRELSSFRLRSSLRGGFSSRS